MSAVRKSPSCYPKQPYTVRTPETFTPDKCCRKSQCIRCGILVKTLTAFVSGYTFCAPLGSSRLRMSEGAASTYLAEQAVARRSDGLGETLGIGVHPRVGRERWCPRFDRPIMMNSRPRP